MTKSEEDLSIRTLEKLEKCASLSASRPARERLGSKYPPLIKIEPHHIIPDELHLLLRITDVLLRNAVWEMVRMDQSKAIRGGERQNLQRLQEAVRACGVTFKV